MGNAAGPYVGARPRRLRSRMCVRRKVNSSKWSVVGCHSARSSNASSTSSGGTKASAGRQRTYSCELRHWFRTIRLITVNYGTGRVDECSSDEVSRDEIAPD